MKSINIFSGDFVFDFDVMAKDYIKDVFSTYAPGRPYFLSSDMESFISFQYRDLSIEEVCAVAKNIFCGPLVVTGFTNRIVFDQQKRVPLLVDPETRQPTKDHETKEN